MNLFACEYCGLVEYIVAGGLLTCSTLIGWVCHLFSRKYKNDSTE